MPLNASAREWQPAAALAHKLGKINVGHTGANGQGGAGSHGYSGRGTAAAGPTPEGYETPTHSNSSEFDQAIEEDLQFDEMFAGSNSGHNSAHSTPRASVSLMKSPNWRLLTFT